jgi:hypothetical protein
MSLNTRHTNLLLISLTIFILLAMAQTAPAQYTGPYTDSMGGGFNNPLSAQMSTMLWSNIFYRTTGASTTGTSARRTNTSAAAPQPATSQTVDASALRFRSSGTRLATQKLADQLGNTPAEREQYLKLMNAVLDGFDQKVKAAGLQNDLGIALSYFLAENARIYHGQPELSDQQFVEIRRVIADAFLSTGALQNINDRQKQEFYEGLVAYTGITQFGYEQSKQANNEAMARLYQKVAGQNLQTVTKMSPDSINLSGDGLATSATNETTTATAVSASGNPIDIAQLRQDYSENEVRADEMYKGKRFIFNGKVVEVSGTYYQTSGQDPTGRYIYTNIGPNLKVTNTGGNSLIGWEVHCFFKNNQQLGQLRGQQTVMFEATVQGKEPGGTTLILVGAALR